MKLRKMNIIVIIFLTSIFISLCHTQAETIREETRLVNAGSYTGWMHTPEVSGTIYIQYQVDEGYGINLLIFDSQNYNYWKDGLTASSELIVYDEISADVSCYLMASVTYYIILDNQDSIHTVHVRIIIQDAPFVTSPLAKNSNLWKPLGIASAILFPIILGTTIYLSSRTKQGSIKEETRKPLQTILKQDQTWTAESTKESTINTKTCPNCQGKGNIKENYCAFCGYKY